LEATAASQDMLVEAAAAAAAKAAGGTTLNETWQVWQATETTGNICGG